MQPPAVRNSLRKKLSPSLAWRLLCLILLFSLLPLEPAVLADASEKAKVNQDIVFLLDTSSSMRNIFDDVRRAILDYSRQAQMEDNIVLITFSEKIDLRFRQKITSPADIKLIERELASLEPDQYYTYMTGALDKGMEELDLLGQRDPDRLRTMVLLSDGKNNPPPSIADPVKFEDLLKRYPGLLQGNNSAFFYLSLGDNPDPEVVQWMEAAKGTSIDLRKESPEANEQTHRLGFAQVFVEPVSLDLGTVAGPEATVPVSLAFFPARGDAAGQAIQLSFKSVYQENPSWKTIMEIKPPTITCSKKPWTTTFTVQINSLHEGTVVGTLELEPLPGDVLFIDPPQIPVTFTTRQPKISVDLRERLEFGPIYPGEQYSKTKTITLTSDSPLRRGDIRITPSLTLPDELAFATGIEEEGSSLVVNVSVESNKDLMLSHSKTFAGTITLSGARYPIEFSDNEIEVVVEAAPPPAKSKLIGLALSLINIWTIAAVAGAAIAIAAGIFMYRYIRSRPLSALEGKLILVNLKDRSNNHSHRLITANLNNLGKMLRRDSIIIGGAKDAGLTLPHKSVEPYHCELYIKVDKGNKRTLLEPIGKSKVIVNLQKIDGPLPLSDRDLIEIGAYTFRFENPHPYKQIVVKYLDGRILKGTPASWDIDSDGFNLLPRDALPGSNEEIYISFSDLKAVYFVRDFDGQIGRKLVSPATQIKGLHLLVTFHDREKIEGYSSESYSPASPRFYFFPSDQSGNTISILVERRNLRKIKLLDTGEELEQSEVPTLSLSGTRKTA